MRLLVSGYAGAGNAGDEAILGGLLRTLHVLGARDGTPHAITVVSADPGQTERLHGVAAIPRLHLDTLKAIRDTDAVISGGGGLLQDATSARPPIYYGGIARLAAAIGRPYVVAAQGLGPLERPMSRWIAARTLRGAAHVWLRDPGSVDLARTIGVRRAITLAPDLAFGLEPPPSDPGDRVVVAVRGRGLQQARLAALRKALKMLAGEREVVVLPMDEPADRPTSGALADGLPNASVAAPSVGHHEPMRLLASATLVVGMRLHALVLAALAGVPAIAIPYDPKVEAFATEVGQPTLRLGPDLTADAVRDAGAAAIALGRTDAYRDRVRELREAVVPAVAAALEAIELARGRGA